MRKHEKSLRSLIVSHPRVETSHEERDLVGVLLVFLCKRRTHTHTLIAGTARTTENIDRRNCENNTTQGQENRERR